jgi:hypothetical protein
LALFTPDIGIEGFQQHVVGAEMYMLHHRTFVLRR